MTTTTFDTIAALLEGVIAETEDADVHYKVRTALQLLTVLREKHEQGVDELAEADLDSDLRARLRELGYVD